jgi:hypothetical protein
MEPPTVKFKYVNTLDEWILIKQVRLAPIARIDLEWTYFPPLVRGASLLSWHA